MHGEILLTVCSGILPVGAQRTMQCCGLNLDSKACTQDYWVLLSPYNSVFECFKVLTWVELWLDWLEMTILDICTALGHCVAGQQKRSHCHFIEGAREATFRSFCGLAKDHGLVRYHTDTRVSTSSHMASPCSVLPPGELLHSSSIWCWSAKAQPGSQLHCCSVSCLLHRLG